MISVKLGRIRARNLQHTVCMNIVASEPIEAAQSRCFYSVLQANVCASVTGQHLVLEAFAVSFGHHRMVLT